MSDRADSPKIPPRRRSDRQTSEVDRLGFNPRRTRSYEEHSDVDDDHDQETGPQPGTGADAARREYEEGPERPRLLDNTQEPPAPPGRHRTVPPPAPNPDTLSPPRQEDTQPGPRMATGGGSNPDPASPHILSAESDEETHTVENSPTRDAQGDQQATGNNTLNEDEEEPRTSPTASMLGANSPRERRHVRTRPATAHPCKSLPRPGNN